MKPEFQTINPFQFKLDLIKWELESIAKVIERMDNFAQASKNWAVLIWAGVISLTLSKDINQLRPLLILMTSIVPILFWYIDSFFRRLQRRSIFRQTKISEYINSNDFINDCNNNVFQNFIVVDITGVQYRQNPDYKAFVSQRKTMKYREVSVFYSGLIIISLVLSATFWVYNINSCH